MPRCVVKGCESFTPKSEKDPDLDYFCVPKLEDVRSKWIKFSGRTFKNEFPPHAVFCSEHFLNKDIVDIDGRKKLMPEVLPSINPPKGIIVESYDPYAPEMRKKRGRPVKVQKAYVTILTEEEKNNYIENLQLKRELDPMITCPEGMEQSPHRHKPRVTMQRMLELFKDAATSPWSWLETNNKFYFFKNELPPDMADQELADQFLPLPPTCADLLVIDKTKFGRMTLVRRGEKIPPHYVAPNDFCKPTQTVHPRMAHIRSFIRILKSRRDPRAKTTDLLRFHANSISTLGKCCLQINPYLEDPPKDYDERFGTSLTFLANQMNNLLLEYNKLPHFVPSAIRLALLVRFHSKAAYSVLKECDQLVMPSDNVLAPFVLERAPSGITNKRLMALRSFFQRLNPLECFISVSIDDVLLEQRLNFDSEGKLIGHAVNDTVAGPTGDPKDVDRKDTNLPTPTDALANRMICYMAQGLSKNFHQVVAMYPVVNPSSDFLKRTLLDVLMLLHQTGFHVVIVTSANNSTNKKIYRIMSKRSDDILEHDPVISHPCDPNGRLALSYDPVHLMQSIRNEMFRKDEFRMATGSASICGSLLVQLQNHEVSLAEKDKRAKFLASGVPNSAVSVLKSYRIEKPRIDLLMKIFSQQIIKALKHYGTVLPSKFPPIDVDATCEFLEHCRVFFDLFNINVPENDPISSLYHGKVELLKDMARYFKDVAMPSGVILKTTASSINQTINATIHLVEELINNIGIGPIYTARLQRRALWAQMVEHALSKEKNRQHNTSAGIAGVAPSTDGQKANPRRLPDDVLPPKLIENTSDQVPGGKRGRKRKQQPLISADYHQIPEMNMADLAANENVIMLSEGSVAVLDPSQVVQLTSEQAEQMGLTAHTSGHIYATTTTAQHLAQEVQVQQIQVVPQQYIQQ